MKTPNHKTDLKLEFENDLEALLYLNANFGFAGGWTSPAGMGWDGGIVINENTPEWAHNLANSIVFDLCCIDHPVLILANSHVDCELSVEKGKVSLMRYWGNDQGEYEYEIEDPALLRNLQQKIMTCLKLKTPCSKEHNPLSVLKWVWDSDQNTYTCDTSEFELYDDEEDEDVACTDDQAMEILGVILKHKPAPANIWESFIHMESIRIAFSDLKSHLYLNITGSTKEEDITQHLAKSTQSVV